jgi:hypothetical protein
MQTKQYSPDGKRWWDGTRSLTVSSRRWIVILFFSLFSAVVSLFTIAPTSAGMGSAALFFGSWLVFAVTGGYALAFRRHVFPFAAMSLVLVSMSGWLAGLATSPSSGELPRPLLSTGATAPVVVPSSNVTLTASTSASTVCASSTEHRAVDVDLSSPGPWQAHLVGFNDCEIQSVTYWIRDAKHHWRSSETIRSQPFTAPVQWWQGDNSGYEVVTAHVKLHSGKMLTNPGGWHWVDGHHSSPEGTISVKLNADATAQASYAPALHGSVIQRVDFWLRSAHDRWTRTGPAMRQADGTYSVSRLAGTETADWNGPDAAVAVHVVWPNGAEFEDPTQWTPSSGFVPAPPTPTPTPPPPPRATAPPPAPVAPPPAPVAPAPAPAAPNGPYSDATAAGATAVCADGSWSYSQHRSGTCSHHGGVHWWTGNLGPAGPGDH